MFKRILSVLAGIVSGIIIIYLIEMGSHIIYPFPSTFDMNNPESVKQYIDTAPFGAILFIAIAWAVGSFIGGFVTSLISKSSKTTLSMIVGVILMIAGLINLLTFPHPVWLWIVGLAVFLPSAYLGSRSVKT